jgi:hypothetical protein
MKRCGGCLKDQQLSEYHKNNRTLDSLNTSCKTCVAKTSAKYRAKNKSKIADVKKKWYEANKDQALNYASEYYKNNKSVVIKKVVEYRRNRLKVDPIFKLQKNMRHRLSNLLKQQSSRVAINFLGCTLDEFKIYIESKFYNYMTWDSYGQWEIDHVKPLASFDLSDPNQLKAACHYSNLQPLWKQDHVTKTTNDVRQSKGTI